MEQTIRHDLPLLVQGQGQKDITHNEALLALDALLHPVIESIVLTEPPTDPVPGRCWAVPEGAMGAWAGHNGTIAMWTMGGWRFFAVANGTTAWLPHENRRFRREQAGWVAEAPAQVPEPAVAPPSGGAVIDLEARAALASLLQSLTRLGLIAN